MSVIVLWAVAGLIGWGWVGGHDDCAGRVADASLFVWCKPVAKPGPVAADLVHPPLEQVLEPWASRSVLPPEAVAFPYAEREGH